MLYSSLIHCWQPFFVCQFISALFLRNYFPDMGQDPEVITAWMGLSEMLSSNRRAGLVTAWTQRLGQFTLTGDVKYVRLWDATKESAVQDLPTGAPSCVTCVERTSDGRLIAIGLGDGSARLLDTRCDPTWVVLLCFFGSICFLLVTYWSKSILKDCTFVFRSQSISHWLGLSGSWYVRFFFRTKIHSKQSNMALKRKGLLKRNNKGSKKTWQLHESYARICSGKWYHRAA